MNNLLISTGAVAGIIIALAVLFAAVAVVLFLVLKKKSAGGVKNGSDEFIEYSGNNSSLLTVVDAGARYSHDATVIVPPTHTALIIKNGTITGEFSEGEYPLYGGVNTQKDLKNSVRSLKVIYISKTAKVTVRWGTQKHQRIQYVEPKTGKPVSVGAFGEMDVRASNARKFYLELVANFGNDFETVFSADKLQEHIRVRTVDDTFRTIGKVLNENKITYLDFTNAKYYIQEQAGKLLTDKFQDYFGFEVCNFIIESINILPEQEEEIKQLYAEDSAYDRNKVLLSRRDEMEELERQSERKRKEAAREDSGLDDFLYNRERDRAREEKEYERKLRHEDEEREWSREDKVRETEERIQNKYFDTYKDVEISRSAAGKSPSEKDSGSRHCTVCGSPYKAGAKYCPGCGAVVPRDDLSVKCPSCSAEVPWGTGYCPVCGQKLTK